MATIIICNVLLILCAATLGFFFGPNRGRVVTALAAFQLTLGLSVFIWGIFVAQHFIAKYW